MAIYDFAQTRNLNLANLLKSIASKPENYFEAQTGDETPKLLEAITTKICSEAN